MPVSVCGECDDVDYRQGSCAYIVTVLGSQDGFDETILDDNIHMRA